MQVEPAIVDTNVLVYALDADAPMHAASRTLLEEARSGSVALFVTSHILCAFYSLVTNARLVSRPRSCVEAVNAIAGLLTFLQVLPVPAQAVDGWLGLLRRRPVTGGAATDGLGVALESTRLAERKLASGRVVRLLPEARDVVYAAHFLVFPHVERHRLGLLVFIGWLSAELREVVWDEDVRFAPLSVI